MTHLATRTVVFSLILAAATVSARPAATTVLADKPASEARRDSPALLVFRRGLPRRCARAGRYRLQPQAGIPVQGSFVASSVLARQIEAGAPVDGFLSADRE
jgi:ABC-type molybdate transport system substrate-binding protein